MIIICYHPINIYNLRIHWNLKAVFLIYLSNYFFNLIVISFLYFTLVVLNYVNY